MVEVGRFDTRADAEFARSLLAAAGIPCVLAPNEAAGAYAIDRSGGARVLVADADAHDATVILRDHAPRKDEHE
jgi:Putative prokaryotic signal transducing protein